MYNRQGRAPAALQYSLAGCVYDQFLCWSAHEQVIQLTISSRMQGSDLPKYFIIMKYLIISELLPVRITIYCMIMS